MITDYNYSKIDNYEELRKVQLKQIEILNKIDRICKENSIKYSLAYGSMLGAVRHGGFIPWDDDMDIFMEREDYNKFLNVWKDDSDFILNNHDLDRDFQSSFSKIRKRNTAFVLETDLGRNFHKGIFVDIFPLDRVAIGMIRSTIQKIHVMLYQLFIRGYAPKKNGYIFNVVSRVILALNNKKNYYKLSNKHLKKITKYNDKCNLPFMDISTFTGMKFSFPHNMFDNIIDVEFEEQSFSMIKDYDCVLRSCYGDYMKLPPKDEQTWYHHPIFISFDSEYEED